ncbi:TPA: NTP-binding protein [Pseudomonas aeruginosa]|nr:NTP-binding protein [Pseudomonas aeruginosa]
MQRTPDTVRSIDDCTTAFKPRCLVQSSSENDSGACRTN